MTLHDTETFRSLHALGEHVLCAGRYAAAGRIGLTVVPGGIGTPPHGDTDRVLAVVDGRLVVSDRHAERQAPLTTLRAAGEFAGVAVGAPTNVYAPKTPCRLDAPLAVDDNEWRRIIDWYALVDDALRRFGTEIAEDAPSEVTLWPEHFDVAIRAAEVNYGGLVGDEEVPQPYIYVGPPAAALSSTPDAFWSHSFGAAAGADEIRSVDDAVRFFRAGRAVACRLLQISPG